MYNLQVYLALIVFLKMAAFYNKNADFGFFEKMLSSGLHSHLITTSRS